METGTAPTSAGVKPGTTRPEMRPLKEPLTV